MIRSLLLCCLLSLIRVASANAEAPLPFGSADDPVLLKDPGYRRAWTEIRRGEYGSTYVDVGRVLKLSPVMEDGLLDLLVVQQLERVEKLTPAPSRASEMEAFSRKTFELLARQDAALARFLGNGKFAAWQEYQKTLSWRRGVGELREKIGPGPDALRDDQVESLIAAMLQAQAEMMRPTAWPADAPDLQAMSGEDRKDYIHAFSHARMDERNERIHELATPYLSPTQLAALAEWLSSHQFHEGTARPFRSRRTPQ